MSAPAAAGDYSVARLLGERVLTAGMTPRIDGSLVATGRLGGQLDEADGCSLAALAATRALDAAAGVVPDGQRMVEVVSLTVYIAVDGSFTRLSQVADAASRVIQDRFPSAVPPVRAAVGVATLPGGAPVEVQLEGRVEPDHS